MANGSGVSIGEAGKGKWRVRWRETDAAGKVRQREKVVPSLALAQQLQGGIVAALELRGFYVDPTAPAAPSAPEVATVDAIALAWCDFRENTGRVKQKTATNDESNIDRALAAMRLTFGVPTGQPIPGTLLTRENIGKVTATLRTVARDGKPYSEGTVAATVGALVSAWTWATDDADAFPGLRAAPRGDLLPRQPTYRPGVPPTMAEADASIRHLSKMRGVRNVALPAAIIARWTGLRIGTIMAIEPSDLDLTNATLLVRRDKVAAMEGRRIAVARELVAYLAPLHAEAVATGRRTLLRRRDGVEGERTPDRTLRAGWKAATAADECRPEVWAPPDRKLARPEHAYRAAFQAHLARAGVAEHVVDALVGHRGSTRYRFYVRPEDLLELQREAVALLPPLDWRSNVVQLRERREIG